MSKELTEKLNKNELKDGFYYMIIDCGGGEFTYINEVFDGCPQDYNEEYIKEVLSTVPSYEKVKEMSQKIECLEFDNDAFEISRDELEKRNSELKKLLLRCKPYLSEWIVPMDILAEIDELEEK